MAANNKPVHRWWPLLLLLLLLLIVLPFLSFHTLGEGDLVGKWQMDPSLSEGSMAITVKPSAIFELKPGHIFTITTHPGMYLRGTWHLYGTVVNLRTGYLILADRSQAIPLQDLAIPGGIPAMPRRNDAIETVYAAGDYDLTVSPDRKTLGSKSLVLRRVD